MAALGSPEEWLRKAEKQWGEIGNEKFRTGAIVAAVGAWQEAGAVEEALRVLQALEDENRRAEARVGLSLQMAGAGSSQRAVEVAGEIQDKEQRQNVLHKIARECDRKGMPAEGMKIARTLDGSAKEMALGYMGMARMRRGDLAGAATCVEMMPDPEGKKQLRAMLKGTRLLLEGKSIEEARKEAGWAEQGADSALINAASATAHAGDLEQAIQIASQLASKVSIAECGIECAWGLLGRGRKDDAARMLQWGLQNGHPAPWRLAQAVEIARETKPIPEIRKLLEAAHADLGKPKEERTLFAPARPTLVRWLLELGDLETATGWAKEHGPEALVLYRMMFARYYVLHDRADLLEAYLESCKTPHDRAMTYIGVAMGLARRRVSNGSGRKGRGYKD